MIKQQIPLKLDLKENNTFANFYNGSNTQLVQSLQQLCSKDSTLAEKYIYLWGNSQSGRTHLLQACCHHINKTQAQCFYLSGQQYNLITPAIIENLEQYKLICIDDINLFLKNTAWEESLFHLFNKIKEHNSNLVISSQCAPNQLTNQLADLKSRLCSGLIFKLNQLNDEEKIKALQQRAYGRGLNLSNEASQYILHHTPRDLTNLFKTLNDLDKASLSQQRKLTIPFIKSIIN
jgi:DnaA-homolog protein